MELVSRSGPVSSTKFISSLTKCIEMDAPITPQEKQTWKAVKDTNARLLDPQKGGSYQVFSARPLKEEIRACCVQDVRYLSHLRKVY